VYIVKRETSCDRGWSTLHKYDLLIGREKSSSAIKKGKAPQRAGELVFSGGIGPETVHGKEKLQARGMCVPVQEDPKGPKKGKRSGLNKTKRGKQGKGS